ncbi:MAG: hypothetical protein ABGX22_17590, partial [Pirellulaceae bacterium]
MSDVGGNANVTATTGGITDSGMTLVGGNASFTTLQVGQTIDLDQLGVNGSIALQTATDGDATIVNKTGIDFASSNVGGILSATATTGSITDSATVSVAKTARFDTKAVNAIIDLGQLDVTGSIALFTQGVGGNTSIVNTTQVDLAGSDIGGTLNVTATSGGITDSGMTLVGGNASFTTQQVGQSIDLYQLGVNGSTALQTATDGDATIVNKTGIDFAPSNVGGILSATATTGSITDSGTVSVAKTARFETQAADETIDLDQLDVTGSIALFTQGGAGNASIVNTTMVNLAGSDIGGNSSVTATSGNIEDSGIVSIGGRGSFATVESGADIDLGTLDASRLQLTTIGPDAFAHVTNQRSLGLDSVDVQGAVNVLVDGGDLVVSGNVASGNLVMTGKAITLHATGSLDVLASSSISSATGDGGSLSLHNVDFLGNIDVGRGDISLSSDNGATTRIRSPISTSGPIRVTASQDVLIEAAVDQTTAASIIEVVAGTGNGVDGGVRVIGSRLHAVGDISVSGGMFVGPAPDSFGIQVDVGSTMRSTLGDVTLDTRPLNTLIDSDVQLNGEVSGIAVSLDVGRDVQMGTTAILSAGTGGVLVTTGRDFKMSDGAQVTADAIVSIATARDLDVAHLRSSSSGLAVHLASESVMDAGDLDVDIFAPTGRIQFNVGSVGSPVDPLEIQVETLSGVVGPGGIAIHEPGDLIISILQSQGSVQVEVGGKLSLDQLSSDSDVQLNVVNNVLLDSTTGFVSAMSGLLTMNVGGAVGDAVPVEIRADRLRLDAGQEVRLNSTQLNFAEQLEAGQTLDWETVSTKIAGTVRSKSGLIRIVADDLDVESLGRIDAGLSGRLQLMPNGEFVVGTSSNPMTFAMTDAEWDRVISDVVHVTARHDIIVADSWSPSMVKTLHLQTPGMIDASAGLVEVNQLAVEAAGWLAPGKNQIDVFAFVVTDQFVLANDLDLRIAPVDGVTEARYSGGTPQRLEVAGALQISSPVETTSGGVSIWQTSGSVRQDQPVKADALSVVAGDTVDLFLPTNDFGSIAIQSTDTVRLQDQNDLTLADFNVTSDFMAANADLTIGGRLVVDGQVLVT